jgi:hypothetical protein
MSTIPYIGSNEVQQIGIQGPSIIPAINPPIVESTSPPVIRGLELPVFRAPDPTINYPVIDVPTQEEFDAAVRAEKQKQQEATEEEKTRQLPDSRIPTPQLPQVTQTSPSDRVTTEQPSTNLGVPIIEVPIIGQIPIPPKEQVILAGTTATASVAAALVGKSLVEWMVGKMKPIVQQILVRGKKLLKRDLTPYELQIYFAFEKSQSLKKVNKLLKKEQKKDKQRQYKEFHEK